MIFQFGSGSGLPAYLGIVFAVASANATAGCNRPSPVVICHNSNCTGSLDPDRDDTIAALEQSLALGPQILDGIEVDAVWQDGDCYFAHELGQPNAPLLLEPLNRIAEYVRQQGSPRSGAPFTLLLELKSAGTTDAQLDQCALRALDVFRPLASEMPIEILISSFDQTLLSSLAMVRQTDGLNVSLGAEIWTTAKQSALGPRLDFVSVSPGDVVSPAYTRYRDAGFEVALWNEQVTPQFLDAVQFHAPQYVSVSEAALMRAWIGR